MNTIGQLIFDEAKKHQLLPQLVGGIILQESAGRIYSSRYEPKFFKRYLEGKKPSELPGYWPDPNLCSEATEMRNRATSYGLMHVLGETMREEGFKEPELTMLFDPKTNLEWGCAYFAKLVSKKQDGKKALLAWNGGGDKEYADKVFAHIDSGRAERLLYESTKTADLRSAIISSLS
jgi:hypothetical protein